ncbi:MAG: 1-(5-phosphoribosyl)-5-amino-4-imidazole-carboxylate carboxylase, partial [Deltaproteobacteria bacterium]|nr:1-(5-phosphoribosyl)-5-amino-4-imidazole-carboxylate carboxylase [Deltaproteobacteria bacterium]
MNEKDIKAVLEKVRKGGLTVDQAVERLRTLPFEDIGFATIDHHRTIRKGFPEVIFGQGKTAAHIIRIMKKMAAQKSPVLATRLDAKKAGLIKKAFPKAVFHAASGALTLAAGPVERRGRGTILVISAGTSDIPVAEEALVTADIMGNCVDHIYDVGVAGIHRLMNQRDKIMAANVIIVVAGMEGA